MGTANIKDDARGQPARPIELAQCSVCDEPLVSCWQFRADDKFCGLCQKAVLHLLAQQQPSPKVRIQRLPPDGGVWLYKKREQDLHLYLLWKRGLAKRPVKRWLRPEIDFHRCDARFYGEEVGGELSFALEPADDDGKHRWVLAHLKPRFRGFENLKIPPKGVRGRLTIATSTGREVRDALLLPYSDPTLVWRCTESSIKQKDNTWLIYEKGKAVVVPLEVKSSFRICILGAGRGAGKSSPNIELFGFEQIVELGPGLAHRFELRINNQSWTPRERMPFCFELTTTVGEKVPIQGHIALEEGRRLEIIPAGVPEQVQLGEVFVTGFTLTASEGEDIEEPGISLRRCSVECRPNKGDWLRILTPTNEQLQLEPLTIAPLSSDPIPKELSLEVDTTRLDREQFDQKPLWGCIELLDTRDRVWKCELRVTVCRPPELKHFVGIDWGTTNSFAAYSADVGGQEPTPVLFSPYQRAAELFPSDMYFMDVGDEKTKTPPVFLTGFDAQNHGKVHPECLLRSVKRKFQFRETVTVMDERQRTRTFRVEEVVQLLLHRLICQAEVRQKQELLHFGLTFPTKWAPRVRSRFEQLLRRLARQLQEERRPYTVEVLEPVIDEANGVALNVLTTPTERELPERFYLVAYDFGGGTVDTTILESTFDEKTQRLRTCYVGIGGRADFGGDDVTRAVMMLLHERLSAALKRRDLSGGTDETPIRVAEVPLVPDGEPLRENKPMAVYWHRIGRINWDALWETAELIKRDLCDATGPTVGNPVRERLRSNAIHCRIEEAANPQTLDRVLVHIPSEQDLDQFYNELCFNLDDACGHPLDDFDNTNRGRPFTVRQRIEETIQELRWQCDDATRAGNRTVEPWVIVLAGGGCRLRIIADLMRQHFPPLDGGMDRVLFQADVAKQRVAYGMANYLALRRAEPQSVEDLGRSVDVLHHHLGLRRVRFQRGRMALDFTPIVRVGTAGDAPSLWHPFAFSRAQIAVEPSTEGLARLMLYLQDWRHGPREFGYFDLSRAEAPLPGDDCLAEALPLVEGATYEGELRLRRSTEGETVIQRIEVRVTYQGRCYGLYPLVATVADPESLLHG